VNVYVWKEVKKCSDSYHEEGGVVVFAGTEDEARQLANAEAGCAIEPQEQPDEVRACADGEKKVFIMPNAGCC
jgi:hypothetical protein